MVEDGQGDGGGFRMAFVGFGKVCGLIGTFDEGKNGAVVLTDGLMDGLEDDEDLVSLFCFYLSKMRC